MRERYAREHGEKKIDARRREREERMTRWYCGKLRARAVDGERGRQREEGGGGIGALSLAKNSRDAVRPVHDR